jgi:hypothetical protein
MKRSMTGLDLSIVAACLIAFAAASIPLAGSMIDDTYIHMQYARNLAEAGELSFNRGDPSYGATSPLWVAILALLHLGGANLAVSCRLLSWAAGALSVWMIYLLVIKLDGRRLVAGCAAAVLACEAWALRWSATGMESSFAMLMSIVCIHAALTASKSAVRSAVFGLALFLAFLVRPEAGLMVPAAFAAFTLAERGISMRRRFSWIIVFAALAAVWLIFVRSHTGTFLPLTAGAKQGRPVFGANMLRSVLVPLKIIGVSLLVPALSAAVFIVTGVFRNRDYLEAQESISRGGFFFTLLWVFILPALYVIFDFHVLSRYLLLVTPAIIVVGMTGISRLLGSTGKRLRYTVLLLVTAATVLQSLVFYFSVVVRPTREFSRGLEEVLVPMAEWIEENTPDGSVVATPDIGAIGYFSGREVLDLGGLVTPEINDMRREIDVERIIEEGLYLDLGADFLVDRHPVPERFDNSIIRGMRFTALYSGVVSNLGIRKPDPVTYVLYRIDPAAEEGGR